MMPSLSSIIWLGCGELSDVSDLSLKRSVLVEPRKDVAALLKQKFSGHKSIQVLSPFIGATSEEAEFYHYNLPEFSSLSPISGLKTLFPGIKLERTEQVSTTAVDDFIISLSLDPTEQHKLVIDIIDQTLPLLEVLAASHLLDKFCQLEIQSSRQALYQGAVDSSAICRFLAQQGFDLIAQDCSDPDFPRLSFKLNPLWQPLQQARHAAQQSADKNVQLELAKQELRNEKLIVSEKLALAEADYSEKKQSLEQQLNAAKHQLNSTATENEALQQQLSAAKVAAEKLSMQFENLQEAQKLQNEELAASKNKANELVREIQNLRQEMSDISLQNDMLQKVNESAKKMAEVKQQQFNELFALYQGTVRSLESKDTEFAAEKQKLQEDVFELRSQLEKLKHYLDKDLLSERNHEPKDTSSKASESHIDGTVSLLEQYDESLQSLVTVRKYLIDNLLTHK